MKGAILSSGGVFSARLFSASLKRCGAAFLFHGDFAAYIGRQEAARLYQGPYWLCHAEIWSLDVLLEGAELFPWF
jgi:hypothetical protein